MNESYTILRQVIRSLIIEDRKLSEGLLLEQKNPLNADIMRRAVQIALASTGRFDYSSSSSSRSLAGGIRVNPAGSLGSEGVTKDDIVNALEADAKSVGLELSEEIPPTVKPSGRKKEISGTFISWKINNIKDWLVRPLDETLTAAGTSFLQKALSDAGRGDFEAPEIIKFLVGKELTDEYLVVNSRSLQNKLFTGQGLGELAEHAAAAAINGEKTAIDPNSPSGGFKNAVEGAILKSSWEKAVGNPTLMSRFADAYIKMRDKAAANIQKIPNFDFGRAEVEGGTGTYDVVTSTALIHVKYDDPSRLSGIQQKTEDLKKAKKSTPDEEIAFGTSDRYWKNQRAAFKAALGDIGKTKKDKELLGEWGFYEVLLSGGLYTKTNQSKDPKINAWLESITPGEIADKLVYDINTEYGKSQRVDSTGKPLPQFYFSYFPLGEDDYRLKIERLGFGDQEGSMDIKGGFEIYDAAGRPTEVKNLEIRMNPSYSGREGGTQIGRPYIAVSGNNVIFEIEFRAESASKPIQLHRGEGFSAALDAEGTGTTMANVLVNELRRLVRQTLLKEELTSSDKKEIERLAKRQAKALLDRELSGAIEKEIKKRNGAFKKQTDDAITARFKNAKTDKDFDEAVIKISKRVLKALHDMHYKRTNLIDKMPVPKN